MRHARPKSALHASPRESAGRFAPAPLALALLAACGTEHPELPPGETRRLAWEPIGAAPSDAPSRLARYQVFASRPDWTVMAGKSSVAPIELADERPYALWLSGPVGEERALEVRIGGRFDPKEVDLVEARLVLARLCDPVGAPPVRRPGALLGRCGRADGERRADRACGPPRTPAGPRHGATSS